jgi:hypothetical protein
VQTFLYIAVPAAVVLGQLFWWHIRKATAESLQQVARRRGWRYVDELPELAHAYEGAPFGSGRDRRALSVVTGEHRDRKLQAFEYVHDAGEGGSAQRVHHTVVVVNLPGACPKLEVTLEHAGHKLPGPFGVHDLELGSERFNVRFRVRTDTDRFAYDVLHPRTMEWMLDDPRATAFAFRFDGPRLVCWEQGALDVGRLLAMIDYACDHLDRVPDYAWVTERR